MQAFPPHPRPPSDLVTKGGAADPDGGVWKHRLARVFPPPLPLWLGVAGAHVGPGSPPSRAAQSQPRAAGRPPRSRRAGRPLRTIFRQGERAAPGWYAALGIPAGRSPRLPFLGCRPPSAPRRARGGRTGPGTRSPCGAGSGARGSPGWRGASPPPRLPFMACVRAGDRESRGESQRQRSGARDTGPETAGDV